MSSYCMSQARAALSEACGGAALRGHAPHLDGDVEAAVRLAAGLALLAPALVELLDLIHGAISLI